MQSDYLMTFKRVIGSKPKGYNLLTELLSVRSHFILRAIFRKYKKLIKKD